TALDDVVLGSHGRGTISVSGFGTAPSKMTIAGTTQVGADAGGVGIVAIGGSQAEFDAADVRIATAANALGVLDGSTRAKATFGQLIVGDGGSATATVRSGAHAQADSVIVGRQGTGTLTVDGSGSVLLIDHDLTVGGMTPVDHDDEGNWTYSGGTGTLSVTDG